ncbi:MAG: septum formation protein Maf [Candidatus Omnitrophota bacterium]|jgi:MAF protein|nr:MAG: septum formation protein Maf [Candidatus Omnitrophota bacterium]
MELIYLASRSAARRKLLKSLGLRFRVVPARINEIMHSPSRNYPHIVKANALMKAESVARKIKKGIVIGADTIVVQGNTVYGKPRTLKEAKRMLIRLSSKPHWVYSGFAIIDLERNIRKTGYDKTKVYMDKLSPKQLKDYFSKVHPLSMAGGFDIQGQGALFIRKINGCFYTVVGIPISKLFAALRKIGILLFLFVLPVLISGCSTEYNIVTGRQEAYFYSTDKEIQMGKNISKEVEKEYKLDEDPLVQKRVRDIGKKIALVCDRKDVSYIFNVIDDEEVNAFALPGGFVYVNKGLIDKVDNDDELAAVLAHEVAHVVARHSIKKLQAVMGYSLLRIAVASVPDSSGAGTAADYAFTEILLGYSRDDELLADQLGARYTALAGYKPGAMIDFLEKLQEINKRKPLRPKNYFKTHPYVPDRIRIVKQELGQDMDFNDYINIEEIKKK